MIIVMMMMLIKVMMIITIMTDIENNWDNSDYIYNVIHNSDVIILNVRIIFLSYALFLALICSFLIFFVS